MIFGFVDFEATSVDPKTADIIEWGFVRYCSELKSIVSIDTELVNPGCEIPSEVEKITGITNKLVKEHGERPFTSLEKFVNLSDRCDYLVAHNGLQYDRPLIHFQVKKYPMSLLPKPWIDTRIDIPYPEKISTRKLEYLAYEHGFINPLSHRALTDCLAMWGIFCKYPLEEILESASTELVKVKANTTFTQKDLAKKAGFNWDAEKKIWVKEMRAHQLKKETYPFQTTIL